jgi:glucose-1-phosphate cytidylyltransferase
MKVVILAGGLGTRLSEETTVKPKPMVEVGGRPILWHIMKIYSSFGFNEFIILLGYKGEVVKQYFSDFQSRNNDVTFDLSTGEKTILTDRAEPWRVTLVDTGENAMTGARVKRAQPYVGNEPFFLTYGDGLANVDVKALWSFHCLHKKALTMTAVQPAGRFGALELNDDCSVTSFREKPRGDGSWINGGFFVCQPEIFDYLCDDDAEVFEGAAMGRIVDDGQCKAYKHGGFFMPMDTLRDKTILNTLWADGSPPWKVW